MKLDTQKRHDLAKDVRKLVNEVRKDVERIEKRADLPQFGASAFRGFERRFGNKLGNKYLPSMTTEQLQTMLRDIKYIRGLKSTTIEGAQHTKDVFLPLREELTALSEPQRDKFREIYNKFVEERRYLEEFKYELQEIVKDMVYSAVSVDEALTEMGALYDKASRTLGKEASEDEKVLLFSQNIREFLS